MAMGADFVLPGVPGLSNVINVGAQGGGGPATFLYTDGDPADVTAILGSNDNINFVELQRFTGDEWEFTPAAPSAFKTQYYQLNRLNVGPASAAFASVALSDGTTVGNAFALPGVPGPSAAVNSGPIGGSTPPTFLYFNGGPLDITAIEFSNDGAQWQEVWRFFGAQEEYTPEAPYGEVAQYYRMNRISIDPAGNAVASMCLALGASGGGGGATSLTAGANGYVPETSPNAGIFGIEDATGPAAGVAARDWSVLPQAGGAADGVARRRPGRRHRGRAGNRRRGQRGPVWRPGRRGLPHRRRGRSRQRNGTRRRRRRRWQRRRYRRSRWRSRRRQWRRIGHPRRGRR